jgi:hypothetical protein
MSSSTNTEGVIRTTVAIIRYIDEYDYSDAGIPNFAIGRALDDIAVALSPALTDAYYEDISRFEAHSGLYWGHNHFVWAALAALEDYRDVLLFRDSHEWRTEFVAELWNRFVGGEV